MVIQKKTVNLYLLLKETGRAMKREYLLSWAWLDKIWTDEDGDKIHIQWSQER